ncbi:MAG: sulfur oxidation c-type cytochrome SoxA [Burkholderiales bacterium]|nr:sulfur oxidation c-type cytochrome SoxA [Burkholderiales bacterium]
MLKDGNPADLMELRGAALWTTPRGPRHATLEACDLGLGPGVVDGAYARLPRWFDDTGRVQDVESRLVTCMVTLQGFRAEDAMRDWYRPASDLEALVTYVAVQSQGQPIDAPATHPREAEMAAIGEVLFFRRAGPLDFSCATCHSQRDRRIRLQELPDFLDPAEARASITTWPAYRVSQSNVWTMERRLIDCIRQMRAPDADFGSDAIIALETWLQKQATGGVLSSPGIKR